MDRNLSPEARLAAAGVEQLPKQRLKETERRERTPRFALVGFGDIKPLADEDYCVKGLLPRTGLAVVWGAPKCGKSFWTTDVLMHIALGWKYRGLRVRQGAVVYVCLEGANGFRKRVEAFRKARLKGGETPAFFLIANPLRLAADVKALIGDIRTQLAVLKPIVICIDTLNRSFAGSESSDEDMTNYIRAADTLGEAFNALVVLVHHAPHDAERPRGHSSLMGATDVQIGVRNVDGVVIAELELAKDMDIGLVFTSRLERVELGRDSDGDSINSCVVAAVEETNVDANVKAAAKATKGRGRADNVANLKRAILDAYDRLADAVDKTRGLDGAPVKKVSVDALRDEVKRRGFLETKDTGGVAPAARKQWERAKTDLLALRRLIELDGLVWRPAPRDSSPVTGPPGT
jgi:hypothetical protein